MDRGVENNSVFA